MLVTLYPGHLGQPGVTKFAPKFPWTETTSFRSLWGLSSAVSGQSDLHIEDMMKRVGSSHWKNPLSMKARQIEARPGVTVFFDICEFVHCEFAPKGQTVNADFYCKVLRSVKKGNRRKRPNILRESKYVLCHGNYLAHTSRPLPLLVLHKSVPCYFFLFPRMKCKLTGRRSFWHRDSEEP